MSDI